MEHYPGEGNKIHKISRLLEIILAGAIAIKASDIHIEPEKERGRLRLRLDGVDLGGRLSESSWAFLDTLTEFHPRGFDRASDNDGILVPEHRIANRISACNARRELQRQLPQGVKAKWFVQTIQGKGYRLRADVRIRGRGEAGLQFHDGQKLAVLYPHDGGAEA